MGYFWMLSYVWLLVFGNVGVWLGFSLYFIVFVGVCGFEFFIGKFED